MLFRSYKYTSPSGKCYIGQTIDEKRRKLRFKSKRSYGSNKIDNARNKYGSSNFTYEILEEINSNSKESLITLLNIKEKEFILKFNTINNGYNYQIGGTGIYTYVPSDEVKLKISKSKSKAVLQYDLNGDFIQEWDSLTSIRNKLNIQTALISKNCKNQTSHCRDFIFRYKTDNYPLKIEVKILKLNKTSRNSISQFKNDVLIKTWKSITEASKELKIDRHLLSKIADKDEYKGFTYKLNI